MTLVELGRALRVPYQTLHGWVRTGLVTVTRVPPAKSDPFSRPYHHLTFDEKSVAEVLAVERLRRMGVPTRRIRAATSTLRARGADGPRWLALLSDGRDVFVGGLSAPVRVVDGQTILNVLDFREIEAEARKLLRHEAVTAAKQRRGPRVEGRDDPL